MLEMLYSSAMLAVEAGSVINLRLLKICRFDDAARAESFLMVNEKISANFEMLFGTLGGATPLGTVARYRDHVTANLMRLSTT